MDKVLELLRTHKEMIITIILPIAGFIYNKYFNNTKVLNIQQYTQQKYPNKNIKLPENVKIFYNDTPVDKIYRTVIRIWNSGDKVLKKKLIPSKFPLQISTKNTGEILGTNVLGISGKACEIRIHKKKKKSFNITFDFLNASNGLFIELFHTEPLEKIDWEMKGVKIKPVRFLNVYSGMPILYKIFIIFYGFFVSAMAYLSWKNLSDGHELGDSLVFGIYIVVLLIYLFGVFVFPRVPRSLLLPQKIKN